MEQSFTPNYFHSLINSHKLHFTASQSTLDSFNQQQDDSDADKRIYQILTIEVEQFQCFQCFDKSLQEAIVHGNSRELKTYLGHINAELPTQGVDVAFEAQKVEYSTIRFLLQCRRLSQMMSYIWLENDQIQGDAYSTKEEKIIEVKLVKKIFDSYNLDIPKTWIVEGESKELDARKLAKHLLEEEENHKNGHLAYIIKPQYLSYNSIRLALLLSGQAYYKYKGKWKQIWPSIFSTFEMVWEYALDISWDTFYATRKDISQAGKHPIPPYTKVTIGYPPRPSEFNVTQSQIKEWATADEWSDPLPFYPEDHHPKKQSTFTSQQLQFVLPPYPYIPLSCS